MTNVLKRKIIEKIREVGPIGVDEYMRLCLTDEDHGYYRFANPIGVDGDFITAPEISQLFGEIVAIWLVTLWARLAYPSDLLLCELGAGRGTLMDDLLRTLGKICPQLLTSLSVVIIDSSQLLRRQQQKKLLRYRLPISWRDQLGDLPQKPTIFIANEFFDALPIRQFIEVDGAFSERKIDLGAEGELVFCTDKRYCLKTQQASKIIEVSTERSHVMEKICSHLATNKGGALIVDYGSLTPSCGDSLQAVSRHKFCDPLAEPGQADLTSHVDFYSLVEICEKFALKTKGQTQGQFLREYGIIERAMNLARDKSVAVTNKIIMDVKRLIDDNEMGTLFKVLSVESDPIITNT